MLVEYYRYNMNNPNTLPKLEINTNIYSFELLTYNKRYKLKICTPHKQRIHDISIINNNYYIEIGHYFIYNSETSNWLSKSIRYLVDNNLATIEKISGHWTYTSKSYLAYKLKLKPLLIMQFI